MERADAADIVQASASYGSLFRTVSLDTEGARTLLKAVTANVGLLSPTTTLEEARALLDAGLRSYSDQSQHADADALLKDVVAKGAAQIITPMNYTAGQGPVPSVNTMAAALKGSASEGPPAVDAADGTGGDDVRAQTVEEACRIHTILNGIVAAPEGLFAMVAESEVLHNIKTASDWKAQVITVVYPGKPAMIESLIMAVLGT
eukprot:474033-Amphidinium_carterae.1